MSLADSSLAGRSATPDAGLSIAEADAAVAQLPIRLAEGLTRGQAEDLLAQLARQRVTARIEPLAGAPSAS